MNRVRSNKNLLRTIIFILINVLVIVLIGYFELKKVDNSSTTVPLHFKWYYLVFAFLCFLGTLLIATLKQVIMMKKVFNKFSFKVALQTVVLGFYYNNITPFAVGGQPFQIYHLSRNGFSGTSSAVIPMVEIVSNDIAMTLLVIFSHAFILVPAVGIHIDIGWKIASFVGLFFYILVPLSILFFSRAPKTFSKIVSFGVHILAKLRIVKDEKHTNQKTIGVVTEYSKQFDYLTDSPALLIVVTILSILQRISVLVIPFFVIHAFGGDIQFIVALVTTIIITSAVTFVPTPGNSGASEGVFYAIFTSLNQGYIFWATLIWRFFTYYIYLISGFGLAIAKTPINSKKDKVNTNLQKNNK